MTGRVLELHGTNTADSKAKSIVFNWDQWWHDKQKWMDEHNELRNYLFATSTATTSNQTLPWKNTTTTPKLTQIRDNLFSNYISALFPNDDWLRWEAYTPDDNTKEKKQSIENYMANKTRRGGFKEVMKQLTYDYIDYGVAFATTDYITKVKLDSQTGTQDTIFSGPILKRIHPFDIVMNPMAPTFADTPVIIRSIMSMGELLMMADESAGSPSNDAIKRAQELRKSVSGITTEDSKKYKGYQVDGFGNYLNYLGSGSVEILTFIGDWYNPDTGTLEKDKKIQIIDRSFVLTDEVIPDWVGRNVYMTTWRNRSDNLWGMGPLDNLVGLQYRIDHLENLKADAMDLHIFPPLKIKGNVDEFDWGPMEEIHMDENGDVEPMRPDASSLNVNLEIQTLMDRMELLAGAPREAMGIRTPGEKTAFEIQQLMTAAGRIFQEKVTNFEVELLEPVLNSMLEQARRNIDAVDVVRAMNTDLGVVQFLEITKNDIIGDGILRPIGARHFGEQSKLMQDLSGIMNGPMGVKLMPHMSGENLARLVEDAMGLERYKLFRPNVGVIEDARTQRVANTAVQQNTQQAMQPEE